jgi:uncharacterized protein (DUF1800 family)
MFSHPRFHAAVVSLLLPLSWAAQAQTPTTTVVEYYNINLKHYFITGLPEDISYIDSGKAGPGWIKTGVTWGAYKAASDAPGLAPVCRFYAPGPNSHFYTAVQSECDAVKTYPGWVYEGISHYTEVPSNGVCRSGTQPIYRVYNNRFQFNDSNHRFTLDFAYHAKAAVRGESPEGVVMCAPVSAADTEADAIRLLKQATFGPTEASIDRVKTLGISRWLDEQFDMAASRYPTYAFWPSTRPDTCVNDTSRPDTGTSYCARDNYTLYQLQRQFFLQAINAEDQLRQRMAFALSQVLVTSGVEIPMVYGMQRYQQMLRDNAFGNFEKLLLDMTLSPVMGRYLDMVNNRRLTNGVQPNENYARELLQLFAVGVYQLNTDGTVKRDANGIALASYGQADIMDLTRALTGFTYAPLDGAAARAINPLNYLVNMVPSIDATYHDTTAKSILGSSIAAGGNAMSDATAAVRIVFNHPNVGPFISKQLIQKLVTSDPSAGYVERVAAQFNNNGSGVRGDLKAVLRAILLDPEARGPRKVEPTFGKLKEPVLYLTGMLRALYGRTDGVWPRDAALTLAQNVFMSPTVFNYYPPDYLVPGTVTLAPEFGLQDSTTSISRINVANTLLMGNAIAPSAAVFGATGTGVDLTALQALAGSDPGAMVDRLGRIFLAGAMSAKMRSTILTAVNAIAASDTLTRARTAAYLVASSSQAQVDR